MPVNAELRSLDIAIPAKPQALVELSLLLADEDVNLDAVARLIEGDMALAAAVLKAVNSSLYGLRGRVQTVQQAITYLGTREVVGIAYEMGLRAAFGPADELDPLWQRAALRGLVMGRLAQKLSLDAWVAHSAGLFEECGKAVLFRHAPDHYRAMMRAAPEDLDLVVLERAGFGMGHDELGARLCEAWMLAPEAASSVRHHLEVRRSGLLPETPSPCGVCAVSAIVWTMMEQPEHLAAMVDRLAPQIDRDPTSVLRAAHAVLERADTTPTGTGAGPGVDTA